MLPIAVRSLAKSRGFTLIALLTLALGIGVNTSMVSVVTALLYRPGPFPEPERIVQIVGSSPQEERRPFSAVEVQEIRERTTAFASLTTIGRTSAVAVEADRPSQRIGGVLASADFFTTFGVQPMLGRAFTATETEPGRNQVIVLSHLCWQNRYGGRTDVIGRTLRLDGETVEIIGVMPASFDYRLLWQGTQYWRPLNFTPEQQEWRDYRMFQLIGRLAPNRTPADATAEIAPLAATQAETHPESYAHFRYRVRPLHETLMDQLGHNISWLLLGLSAFVLLIACANLANLQLARALARARDLAIRSALGASRRKLILHQLQESVLLALGGGVLGMFVAWALNAAVSRHFVIGGGTGLPIPIDGTILLVAMLVSLLAGVVFGIAPAWLASRTNMNAALKAQSRGSTAGRGHHLLRRSLVVAEVSLALVLLGGAALMQRGFAEFLEREPGWDTDRIITASLSIPESRFENYAARNAYFRRLETRLAQLPGVEHAALATSLPIYGYSGERPVLTEGQSPADAATLPKAFHVMVTSDYFAALGIRLVEGTLFPPEIPPNSRRMIILNESLARQLWPRESAVGRRLSTIDSGQVDQYEVIGVVRDVDDAASLRPPATPFTIYKPLAQEPWGWVYLVLRSATPATLADVLRRAATEVDPELPANEAYTVPELIAHSQHNLRLAGKTLVAFAGLGLLLTVVGIYGVISSLVAQRTTEFGVRLALGAQPRDVHALVLRDGMILTAIGLLLGVIGAFFLSRALDAWMPRLVNLDPLMLVLVAAGLFIVAIIACLVPAHRATKVDPLTALRAD